MKVLSSLNFGKKAQLVDLVIHKVSTTLPTVWEGGLVYVQTGDFQGLWYGTSSAWVKVGDTTGLYSTITGGDGIEASDGSAGERIIKAHPDTATIEFDDGAAGAKKLRLKDESVSWEKLKAADVETTLVGSATKIASAAAILAAINAVDDEIPSVEGTDPISVAYNGTTKTYTVSIKTSDHFTTPVGVLTIGENAITGVELADDSVDTSHLKTDSVETVKIKNKNVTFGKIEDITANNVLGNIGAGNANVPIDNLIPVDEPAAHSSVASTKAIHAYVANQITGLGQPQGGYSASANAAFPGGVSVVKGDYWWITSAGSLGTAPNAANLDIGDVIIANKTNPNTTSKIDWVILETNREAAGEDKYGWVMLANEAEAQGFSEANKVLRPLNLAHVRADTTDVNNDSQNNRFITPQVLNSRTATETRRGVAEIATQGEVDTGTDDERIVTPAKLMSVTNGIDTEIGKTEHKWLPITTAQQNPTVTHNFNTYSVRTQVFRKLSGSAKELVQVGITNSSVNQCTINFADASLNDGEYELSVTKVRIV